MNNSPLPDSIPISIWDEFKAHRKKLKKPMTEYAETLILCKLEKWRVESGANPIDVLNESIEKGWTGVFLNGHGRGAGAGGIPLGGSTPLGLRGSNPHASTYCISCKAPLTSGYVQTSEGKMCHGCKYK